jgi:cytochrome P450
LECIADILDQTGNIVANFFLAMMLHPEVQAKARDEIDRVIGPTRLPNFEDRKDLPYVEMVVWETFRWHPVGPLALPHMTTAEDVCEGYLIPAGALVIPNIW